MRRNYHLCAILAVMATILIIAQKPIGATDGKMLYRNKCGTCHQSGGEAPIFGPAKYAASQWERFFSRERHKQRYKDIGHLFSEAEMQAVAQYLMNHAADSDRPEAAGLR
jgi:mono/diheme cytochrome c family protein